MDASVATEGSSRNEALSHQNKNRRLAEGPIACRSYENFLFCPEYEGEDLVTVAKVSHIEC